MNEHVKGSNLENSHHFDVSTLFSSNMSSEQKYQKIIELGNRLADFPEHDRTEENLVPGCQSQVYLNFSEKDGKLFFNAYSEALISAGLAFLCISSYSGLTAEEILKSPPTFVETLGLTKSLSPGRSNGLASMISSIKKKALNFILLRN